MAATVGEVYHAIDQFAPFALAEEWDNSGILAGSEDQKVTAVLCALDLNQKVIEEAVRKGANLIVTHHPILFRGRKNLREDDGQGRMLCALVRNHIALIAAHTNFDNANPGVNDALATCIGLRDICALENGMRIGKSEQDNLGSFVEHVGKALGGPVRCYGEADRPIRSVAVLGGAGGDFAQQALKAGADVYLTGEISHHVAWDAYESGLCVLEAGHAATELPAVEMLAEALQKAENSVKWNVCIYVSDVELFR